MIAESREQSVYLHREAQGIIRHGGDAVGDKARARPNVVAQQRLPRRVGGCEPKLTRQMFVARWRRLPLLRTGCGERSAQGVRRRRVAR